jgi:cyclomaltodextrinase / maltogenic alpha-amylase / neopullulanase
VATVTAAVGPTSTLGESRGREQNHPQHSNVYSAHYQYLSIGVILLKRHMQNVLHVLCQVETHCNGLKIQCVRFAQLANVHHWRWFSAIIQSVSLSVCRMTAEMRTAALLVLLLLPTGAAFPQDLSFASREARPAPQWLLRLSIYELWLNAFSTEGTLRGAIPRLAQVADLGAKVVYLGPIAKRSATPHASPYSIADYNAIDPEYGNEQDLREFVSAAHKLGLKVMLDIVYYHAAPDSVMLKNPDFFVKTQDGRIARGFWPQPLPDYRNAQVRKYLIDSLVHWVRDFKIDGYRCDVGGGVPVAFWEQARKALDRVDPNVILLSESDRPDDQLHAFDINYNFQYYLTLRSVLRDGAPAINLRENWEKTRSTMPHGARLLHYSDNHDWPRAVREFGEKGAMAASILNFTLDGIPFIYNGQEIGDATPTHWRTRTPIHWSVPDNGTANKELQTTLAEYKKLFRMRASYPALTSGEVIWINNTEPNSVLSFLRKRENEEILVILNLSNRNVNVTIDLPVMDYYSVENLLTEGKTWFQLYSGRVSANLEAFQAVVGKRIPLAPLEPNK